MKEYKYTWGKDMTGLYIDVDGSGQSYNILLFVQHFSKRSKRGIIQISDKPFKEAVWIEKRFEDSMDRYYWFCGKSLNGYKGISLDFCDYKAKILYIKVLPNGYNGRYILPNKTKS